MALRNLPDPRLCRSEALCGSAPDTASTRSQRCGQANRTGVAFVRGVEMKMTGLVRDFGDADAPAGRHGLAASAGVLTELGGEVAEVAGQFGSVVLMRGEAWRLSPDDDAGLVAVEEGFVLISTDTGNGNDNDRLASRRIVLATGHRGTLFVPPGLSERVEALTPCRITIVSAHSLRVLLGLPSMAETIVDAFAEALRERQETIRNCAHVHHSERVLEKLLQLARTYGRAVPGGVRIDFPLTHQLVADMVGSARETVSLALSGLTHEGLLQCQHRRYVLRIGPDELFSTSAVVR
jgi:CRP-like cAMP-binding protein